MYHSSDKKDRLERFVRDNREDFDRLEPDEELWERISGQLSGEIEEEPVPAIASVPIKRGRTWSFFDWRIAASVVLLLGIGFLLYLNNEYGVTRDPQVALNAPAYAREFTEYSQAIDAKRNELIRLTSHNPDLYREFATDLDRLEKNYGRLRSELPQTPNQEALVQAMIQNLQLQIDLLNQQLTVLQRIKKSDRNHEKNTVI